MLDIFRSLIEHPAMPEGVVQQRDSAVWGVCRFSINLRANGFRLSDNNVDSGCLDV